ncbi:DUF4422 domain-containing protein [bacterium]|nr:DUF4422 domain-containing protein [bacterium]
MKKNILKIIIAYHKPSFLLKSNIYLPVHVGRNIAMQNTKDGKVSKKDYKWLMRNLIGDNTGKNISDKNREWCELTGIYWAWKNYDKIGNPDYIGFMHYRRFFDFGDYYKNSDIKNFVKKYDFMILGRSPHDDYYKNNYNQYKLSEYHHIEDFEKALNIAKHLYPKYSEAIDNYLKLDYAHFCNMFIMKRELFFEYCEWLFSILEQLEKEIDITNYNVQERRLFGYIAERLTGIFYFHFKQKENAKFKELPMLSPKKLAKINFKFRVYKLIKKLRPLYFD